MGLRALLPLSPSQTGFFPAHQYLQCSYGRGNSKQLVVVNCAKKEKSDDEEPNWTPKKKQSLISGVIDALDFSQVRSEKDAELLDEARETTQSGDKMTREQYGALRRKIGGTYKDFFKSYVDDSLSVVVYNSGWAVRRRGMGGQDLQSMQERHERRGKASGQFWQICSCGLLRQEIQLFWQLLHKTLLQVIFSFPQVGMEFRISKSMLGNDVYVIGTAT